MRRMLKMNNEFIKLCYEKFKKNDEKFPENWTLDDYEKYIDECNIMLERFYYNKKYEENEKRKI